MIMAFVVLIGAIPHLDPIGHSAEHKSCETDTHEHHFIAYHHHHLGSTDHQEIPGIIDFILGFHTHSDHDRVEMEYLPTGKSEASKNLIQISYCEVLHAEVSEIECNATYQLYDQDAAITDGIYSSRSLRAPPFVS